MSWVVAWVVSAIICRISESGGWITVEETVVVPEVVDDSSVYSFITWCNCVSPLGLPASAGEVHLPLMPIWHFHEFLLSKVIWSYTPTWSRYARINSCWYAIGVILNLSGRSTVDDVCVMSVCLVCVCVCVCE